MWISFQLLHWHTFWRTINRRFFFVLQICLVSGFWYDTFSGNFIGWIHLNIVCSEMCRVLWKLKMLSNDGRWRNKVWIDAGGRSSVLQGISVSMDIPFTSTSSSKFWVNSHSSHLHLKGNMPRQSRHMIYTLELHLICIISERRNTRFIP